MRLARLLGGFALLSVVVPLHAAEAPPDVRTVIVPRARAWCGPSTSVDLYPTNELRQGDRVEVVEELPSGWLAIRPPAGSFSWINNRFLQHIAKNYGNYVVAHEGHPVPVLIGSTVKTDRPTKTGVKLPRGAQVRALGRTMTDDEGTWVMIEPPSGEVRYIRKEDVAKPADPPRTTVVAAGSVRPAPAVPPPPPDGDALWRDAEKAERTGRIADAIRLYRLAGDANLNVNRARADAAYQRAHWLQQANVSTNAPSGSYYYPEQDTRAASPSVQGRVYPLPTDHGGSSAVRLIGPAGPRAANGQLVSTQPGAAGWGTSQASSSPPSVQGRLGKGYRSAGDQRSYPLLNSRGDPIMNVTAGPGVDLTSHIDHNVELWGPVVYYPELRGNLMTVTQVRDLP
jgi:hypothetical protein